MNRRLAAESERNADDFHVHHGTIQPEKPLFHQRRDFVFERKLHSLQHNFFEIRMDEGHHVPAEQLFRRSRAEQCQRRGIDVNEFAFPVNINGVGRTFDQQPVFFIALAPHRLGALMSAANVRFAESMFNSDGKPRKAVLANEIRRALPHHADGRFFAERSRHNDARQVGTKMFQQAQHLGRVQVRHCIIAQRNVPVAPDKLRPQRICCVHPLELRRKSDPPQFVENQFRVRRGIFDD